MFKGSPLLKPYNKNIYSVFAIVEFAYPLKGADVLSVSLGNELSIINERRILTMV
jgi:hypothetical protein